MSEPLAVQLASAIMQQFSYELGDLIRKYPQPAHVFLLNVMRSTFYAMEPLLDEKDRELLDFLKDRTSCVILPSALDPRNMKGEDNENK